MALGQPPVPVTACAGACPAATALLGLDGVLVLAVTPDCGDWTVVDVATDPAAGADVCPGGGAAAPDDHPDAPPPGGLRRRGDDARLSGRGTVPGMRAHRRPRVHQLRRHRAGRPGRARAARPGSRGR